MRATADRPDEIDALKAIICAQQAQTTVQAGVVERTETRVQSMSLKSGSGFELLGRAK